MFDGVPAEQLHQFIAASRTSLPLPLPNIPLSSFPNLQPFDHHHHHHHHQNYNIINPPPPPPPPQELVQLQPSHNQLLHPSVVLHRRENDQEKQETSRTLVLPSSNLEIERERTASMPPELPSDPWSNDELLALLRIRSTMENWFPEFTWEHVSRKLAEVGFKRSAEKCKEKFEEESRYFNNINFNKNFRFLSELEQLYQPPVAPPQNIPVEDQPEKITTQKEVVEVEKPSEERGEQGTVQPAASDPQESPSNDQTVSEKEVEVRENKSNNKKRKRQRRFEMLKVFCEDIVNKLMAQQEEIHSKLLEDMVRRDEEKLAKEEAWKKQEMDRMNKELETMAHEQAIAGDRQATIIQFLKKFTSSTSTSSSTNPSDGQKEADQEPITSSAMVPSASNVHKSTAITTTTSFHTQNNPSTPTSLTEAIAPQSPSSSTLSINPKLSVSSPAPENPSSDHLKTQNPSSNDKPVKPQDLGKRWPRDEVLALINLRCSLFNNADQQDKDKDAVKAPLWERISQGMSEMGYKRNAKRCKEKWENINKYFRKTKDVNKERSLDSRTCPYFHQLSTLYNQGILVPPSDHHQASPPEKHSPENNQSSVVAEGEKNNVTASCSTGSFRF